MPLHGRLPELFLRIERIGGSVRNPNDFVGVARALAAGLGRNSTVSLCAPNELYIGKPVRGGSDLGL